MNHLLMSFNCGATSLNAIHTLGLNLPQPPPSIPQSNWNCHSDPYWERPANASSCSASRPKTLHLGGQQHTSSPWFIRRWLSWVAVAHTDLFKCRATGARVVSGSLARSEIVINGSPDKEGRRSGESDRRPPRDPAARLSHLVYGPSRSRQSPPLAFDPVPPPPQPCDAEKGRASAVCASP
ncbi:hypothetical protein SKAU_G00304710 [Synaphobranchus kaupii]|uniref:Uncharacterized protein n=1 Tax=Synaphobranchus kaupii TaxID=118154 RepID=A0A9Q1EWD8_SYNKA|nr:hypothetical protein SKAU_G00304710 [Synaphobranchus kaupii]